MPQAARIGDLTGHGFPLTPGPGCLTVMVGYLPAWRALPMGMAGAVEGLSNAMDTFMKRPQMTPADAIASLAHISAALIQGGATATAHGAPAAATTAAGMVTTLTATNVALTTTWTAASVVPGGQPAANIAYTEGIKAAAAAAASAVVAAMASLSDMHTCPVPVPIPPHGPGFVTRGSRTVNIGGLPAARQGDEVFEACGGSDPIAVGCFTVNIGDTAGAGAAGGAFGLMPGAPSSPTAVGYNDAGYLCFGPNIRIVGTPEFQQKTVDYLSTLAQTPSGRLLLADIAAGDNTITIVEGGNITQNRAEPSNGNFSDPDMCNGNGTDATVTYFPGTANMYNNGEDWDSCPPEVGLGHELIHGSHITSGSVPGDPTTGPTIVDGTDADVANEEARTIGLEEDVPNGLPDYSGEPYTENTIRTDLGLPPRVSYDDPNTGLW
jgi:type VI secretion system secreted protein VgrG